MRIIDNKKDFYDYLQGIYRDDTIVFDRRNSYMLKKEDFAKQFVKRKAKDHYSMKYKKFITENPDYNLVLLQVCNTFWLILVNCTEYFGMAYLDYCTNYKLTLLSSWKDYDRERKLIDINIVRHWFKEETLDDLDYIYSHQDEFQHIYPDGNSYGERCITYAGYSGEIDKENPENNPIPLLRETGIGSIMDPLDVYLAFEEYFSLEKTKNERTESVNLTNNEKVENHGFNLKNSFRGKV